MRLLKIVLLSLFTFAMQNTFADYLEEIVVTGTRNIDSGPIVYTTTGDFLLQEISLVNDSLEVDERKADVKKTFINLLAQAKKNDKIQVSRGDSKLYSVDSASDFELLYGDVNRKGSLNVILKVNLKDRDKDTKLESIFENFTNSIERAGRTQVFDYADEEISIVNPRQYRKKLISAISKDINHITKSLGPEYRVILDGMDNEMNWQREGEDNVTFSLPYSFKVIPQNINSLVSGYDD